MRQAVCREDLEGLLETTEHEPELPELRELLQRHTKRFQPLVWQTRLARIEDLRERS